MMAVTIKDVAKEAGVSHATVSRALRDDPVISAETANQVKRVAERMGYVPNTSARGLKTRRSGILGVVVRRVDDLFFGQVLNGIEDVLQAEGYSLFLAVTHNNDAKERQIISAMAERRVDGVIFCSTRVNQTSGAELAKFGIPTVAINQQDDGTMLGVQHDDVAGSRHVTNYLLQLGHRRIGYVGNRNAGVSSRDRQLGYQMALTAAQIVVRSAYVIDAPSGEPGDGESAAHQLLMLDELPTAIVCYNDLVAIGVLRGLERAGVAVPADCSVTGFDDITLAAYTKPALTTFNQPRYRLGESAARAILQLLKKPSDTAQEQVVLLGELVVRESTAVPRVND